MPSFSVSLVFKVRVTESVEAEDSNEALSKAIIKAKKRVSEQISGCFNPTLDTYTSITQYQKLS